MFSLIIAVVSIAIVALLAVAAVYYGGDAFTQGQATADAAKLINGGQQLAGAVQMYRNDTGMVPADLSLLTSDGGRYLRALPDGDWIQGQNAILAAVTEAKCLDINNRLGFKLASVPSCADTTYDATSVCCYTE